MRVLLALPRLHGRALEADLQRYYQIDLRDRWRRGDDGLRLLSLRRLGALVSALPSDSAVARAAGGDGMTVTDILLMDVFHGVTGNPHPSRPTERSGSRMSLERSRRFQAARRRLAARRQAIAAGEIT